jgi:hypothetical protein
MSKFQLAMCNFDQNFPTDEAKLERLNRISQIAGAGNEK